eukprot:SAG22_NODE_296_length_12811_cov_14.899780_6_plen_92_part_00
MEELTGSSHTDEQLHELQNSHEDLERIRSAMSEHLDDADLEHLIDEIIPKWKGQQKGTHYLRQNVLLVRVRNVNPDETDAGEATPFPFNLE